MNNLFFNESQFSIKKLIKWSILAYFVATLSGCIEAIKIDQVEILAPENVGLSGEVQFNNQQYSIENKTHTIPMTAVDSLKIDLKLNFKNNLPKEQSAPTALLTQIVKLGFKKDKGAHLEYESATLESSTQNLSDFVCDRGIKISNVGTKLIIDLKDFKSITHACQGSGLAHFDPEKVGYRNINQYNFLKHNFFSLDDDRRLGEEFVVNYLKENRHLILEDNHPATLYIKDVMNNIVAHSDRQDLKPKVFIINAKIMNAFALPGGFVFVFRGLMEKAPSESALTSVLAHEWAHVTARHGTENMTRAIDRILLVLAAKLAIDVTLEVKKVKAKEIISAISYGAMMVGSELFLMNKSRDAELEADTLGTQYAYLSGFNPWGISEMFAVFKAETGRDFSTIEKLMSSHPDHDTRITNGYLLSSQFYPNKELTTPHRDRLAIALQDMRHLKYPSTEESQKIGMGFASGLNQFTKNKLEDIAYQLYFQNK